MSLTIFVNKNSVQKKLNHTENHEIQPMGHDEFYRKDIPHLREKEQVVNMHRFDAPFASIQQAGVNGGNQHVTHTQEKLPKSHPYPGKIAHPRLQTFGV